MLACRDYLGLVVEDEDHQHEHGCYCLHCLWKFSASGGPASAAAGWLVNRYLFPGNVNVHPISDLVQEIPIFHGLDNKFLYSAYRVTTEFNKPTAGYGTGFWVMTNQSQLALITNRHV